MFSSPGGSLVAPPPLTPVRSNPRNSYGLGFDITLPDFGDITRSALDFAYQNIDTVELEVDGVKTRVPQAAAQDVDIVERWAGLANGIVQHAHSFWNAVGQKERGREVGQFDAFVSMATGVAKESLDVPVRARLIRATESLGQMLSGVTPWREPGDGDRRAWAKDRAAFGVAVVAASKRWVYKYLEVWEAYARQNAIFKQWLESNRPPTLRQIERETPLLALTQDIATFVTGDEDISVGEVINAGRENLKKLQDKAEGVLGDVKKLATYVAIGAAVILAAVVLK